MTGDNFVYKYVNSDTPKDKIDYSYSRYDGELFMSAYKKKRDEVITGELIDRSVLLVVKSSIGTELLFNEWIQTLQENSEINNNELNLLLKRFEVTKKLFESYDSKYRPIDKSKFGNYRLYVLFSYVLCLSYERDNKLQYLNALLKVNDINISNLKNCDFMTKKLLKLSIKKEISYINELRNKKG